MPGVNTIRNPTNQIPRGCWAVACCCRHIPGPGRPPNQRNKNPKEVMAVQLSGRPCESRCVCGKIALLSLAPSGGAGVRQHSSRQQTCCGGEEVASLHSTCLHATYRAGIIRKLEENPMRAVAISSQSSHLRSPPPQATNHLTIFKL